MVDLSGTHVAIKGAPVTVWRDETTGASSEAVTLELDRGVPFATALERYRASMEERGGEQGKEEEEPAFYLSRREQYGRHNVLLAIPKARRALCCVLRACLRVFVRSPAKGKARACRLTLFFFLFFLHPQTPTQLSAPHLVYVTRPNTGPSSIEKDLGEILNAYDKVEDPEEVEGYWDAIFEATEHHCMHGAGCKLGADCTQGGRKQVCVCVGVVWCGWMGLSVVAGRVY